MLGTNRMLEGRTALVTGSGQGIGYALAQGLGRAGARIVLNGRDVAKLALAAETLSAEGLSVSVSAFDVTDPKAVAAAVDALEADVGAIDVLVNNAGIQRRAPLEDYPAETWREIMRTNVDSVFFVSQAVARRMIPRGTGKIINIASVQSELARPGIAPYTATKGAIKNLTRGMCTDWAKYGLQVNAIAPGPFESKMMAATLEAAGDLIAQGAPLKRIGRPDDMAGVALFLASRAGAYLTGAIIPVDGGIATTAAGRFG